MRFWLWIVSAGRFILAGQPEDKRREEEDFRTNVESKDAGEGRRGVVTVMESDRAPGTTAEVNPSILEMEPTRVSPHQQERWRSGRELNPASRLDTVTSNLRGCLSPKTYPGSWEAN